MVVKIVRCHKNVFFLGQASFCFFRQTVWFFRWWRQNPHHKRTKTFEAGQLNWDHIFAVPGIPQQKQGPRFSKNTVGVPNNLLYLQEAFKRYILN